MIVAKDVEIPIVGADFEALVTDAVPFVNDFSHLVGSSGGRRSPKAHRALIGFES